MSRAVVTVCLASGLFLTGCGQDDTFVGGSGLIETTEIVVASETQGRVLERRCDEGSRIQAGDTLAIIDPSHLELQLTSAYASRGVLEANLATAKLQVTNAAAARDYAGTEFARVERLLQTSSASQRQFDEVRFKRDQAGIAHQTAQANVKTLEAQLLQADSEIARLERLLRDCFPVAPAPGVVVDTYVEPGELLAPGRPIAKLAHLDTVWVKIYLPAGHFAGVSLGQEATVSTESGDTDFTGTIVWTSPEAEFTPKNVQTEQSRADLVYAVKISIPNPDRTLKIGMPVFVTLED